MYYKTYDYYTAEKAKMAELDTKVEAELGSRSPEDLAVEEARSRESFQKILEEHERYAAAHKRVPNEKKYEDFLAFAKQMRKYTALHMGKISIRAEKNGLGIIEMFFDFIIHSEFEHERSRFLFGMLFLRYEDTHIYVGNGGVTIQVFAELYDVMPVDTSVDGSNTVTT